MFTILNGPTASSRPVLRRCSWFCTCRAEPPCKCPLEWPVHVGQHLAADFSPQLCPVRDTDSRRPSTETLCASSNSRTPRTGLENDAREDNGYRECHGNGRRDVRPLDGAANDGRPRSQSDLSAVGAESHGLAGRATGCFRARCHAASSSNPRRYRQFVDFSRQNWSSPIGRSGIRRVPSLGVRSSGVLQDVTDDSRPGPQRVWNSTSTPYASQWRAQRTYSAAFRRAFRLLVKTPLEGRAVAASRSSGVALGRNRLRRRDLQRAAPHHGLDAARSPNTHGVTQRGDGKRCLCTACKRTAAATVLQSIRDQGAVREEAISE